MDHELHRATPTRRQFLGGLGRAAAAAATGTAILRAPLASAAVSPNDRIRLAVIGTGGMGGRHLDSLKKNPRCEVAVLCDCWKQRYEHWAAQLEKDTGRRPDTYQDFRHVLDRPDIDAVLVATPPHWHALLSILACQAGKDVYVEKPLAPTIAEGRAVVEAARRYGRVVQVGTQQRSLSLFQQAMDIVHSGKLGRITEAIAWIGPNGAIPGPDYYDQPTDPPADLDWDMWQGPLASRPYTKNRHLSWYAYDDIYPGREITNWGPHLFDVLNWGLHESRPLSVQALSGNFLSLSGTDGREDVSLLYEFPGCIVGWEQHHTHTYGNKGYGMRFHGTNGRILIDRTSFIVEPASLGIEEVFEKGDPWIDVDTHHNNFFDCIVSRDRPRADIELGHRATSMCCLGAIACDLNRKLYWDSDSERFVGDEQADRHLYRPYRAPWHL